MPSVLALQSIVDPAATTQFGHTYGHFYDHLMDELYSTNAVDTINGNLLWVPWFGSSSDLSMGNLKSGNSCNAHIDWTHNCMVTDEFSQVGILVSMGSNQQRMDNFYNTAKAIKSTNGDIPAWRVYRNGNNLEPCRSGINGNCDTASDATARIIIALYTGASNPLFSNSAQKAKYKSLATILTDQMIHYELYKECKSSDVGYGDICYWLAAGSNAKRGGMSSFDFTYTGYYQDIIIALLQACAQTGDNSYCDIAGQLGLNFLQAAKYDGNDFSAPPGRSFRWTNLNGVPRPECTGSCNPVIWDDADAPRVLGICQANYYGDIIGYDLPGLKSYCDDWGDRYGTNPSRMPLQYYPDGNHNGYRSGFFSQGLQTLFLSGYDTGKVKQALDNAIGHWTPATSTWDWQPAFGVYHQALAMRALGFAIGRDLSSFSTSFQYSGDGSTYIPPDPDDQDSQDNQDNQNNDNTNNQNNKQDDTQNSSPQNTQSFDGVGSLPVECSVSGVKCTIASDQTSGVCRTVQFDSTAGPIHIQACEKGQNSVEVYRQTYPNVDFSACVGSGCVDEVRGFDKFTPAIAPAQSSQNSQGSQVTSSQDKGESKNEKYEDIDIMDDLKYFQDLKDPVIIEDDPVPEVDEEEQKDINEFRQSAMQRVSKAKEFTNTETAPELAASVVSDIKGDEDDNFAALFLLVGLGALAGSGALIVYYNEKKDDDEPITVEQIEQEAEYTELLGDYVKKAMNYGYDMHEVRQMLVQEGWPEQIINPILSEFYSRNSILAKVNFKLKN